MSGGTNTTLKRQQGQSGGMPMPWEGKQEMLGRAGNIDGKRNIAYYNEGGIPIVMIETGWWLWFWRCWWLSSGQQRDSGQMTNHLNMQMPTGSRLRKWSIVCRNFGNFEWQGIWRGRKIFHHIFCLAPIFRSHHLFWLAPRISSRHIFWLVPKT